MSVIVTEYLPYQGKENFRTPSPDGGVATATGLPYKDRVDPYGEALCSPCPGSCLADNSERLKAKRRNSQRRLEQCMRDESVLSDDVLTPCQRTSICLRMDSRSWS